MTITGWASRSLRGQPNGGVCMGLKVYMLQHEDGRWYKAARGSSGSGGWVEKEQASVWSTKQPPSVARGHYLKKWQRRHSDSDLPVLTIVEMQVCPMGIAVISDDEGGWEGLYINDELVYQGHDVTAADLLEHLGVEHITGTIDLGDGGSFPKQYKDLRHG